MSRRTLPQDKILSPLAVEDGFVVGWAWDSGRPILEGILSVDGEDVSSGLTGQPIPDTWYALATPPAARCGFRLPLPRAARDGRTHRLQVRVHEWQALVKAPKVALEWHEGPCFGVMTETASGHLSGWVAFRERYPADGLPPVEVTDAASVSTGKGFDIALKADPRKQVDGCAVVGRFRVERDRFSNLRAPLFTCLGRPIELERAELTRKVTGEVSGIGPAGIHGWVLDLANPLEQLDLVLVVDGLPVQHFRPSRHMPQLARQMKLLPGELGICGFHVGLPAMLRDGREHRVEVLSRVDGTRITKEPLDYRHRSGGLLEPDIGAERHWAPASAGATTGVPRHSRESGNNVVRRNNAKPQASLIILNRNGAACLDDLFASLLRHNSVPVELIVVDHASTDASLDRIRHWQRYLPIRLEALDYNDSFSASCNRGARLAKAPALLFVNNDIVWLQDALPRILETLEQRDIGIVGVRLLKAEFERGTSALADANNRPQVQHLGVRFTLSGDQYLPYEVTPDDELLDAQYAPQRIGVVTGAVLACRRKEFLDLGGFDEQYVYGLEDVEFCLRAGASGLRTICRNDIVALHHHGYTRLTNRENGMLERQLLNQHRLCDRLGLWLKREVWRDILSGERLLAGETLTIGIAVQSVDADSHIGREYDEALRLRGLLQQHWPHCRVLLLAADADWDHPDDCHLLVALNPWYDLRAMKHPRRDLRTACYVYAADQVAAWQANPSLPLYDLCLFRDERDIRSAVASLDRQLPVEALNASAPLSTLADAMRLRVAVLTSADALETAPVTQLVAGLRAQGALVCVGKLDEDGDRPLLRVADVHITLFGRELAASHPPFVFRRKHDVLDILWVREAADALRPSDVKQADEVWHGRNALPAHLQKAARKAVEMELVPGKEPRKLVSHLRKLVDRKVGRSFHTS